MPWGTSSTSILPLAICSSLAVGVPGRTENAAISFFTWLFSARIWPRVAPASPRELQTSVSSFVPWSRRAQIRAVAKRCATPNPAMATVAPLGMSATACSGNATILFMESSPLEIGGAERARAARIPGMGMIAPVGRQRPLPCRGVHLRGVGSPGPRQHEAGERGEAADRDVGEIHQDARDEWQVEHAVQEDPEVEVAGASDEAQQAV